MQIELASKSYVLVLVLLMAGLLIWWFSPVARAVRVPALLMFILMRFVVILLFGFVRVLVLEQE